MDRDELSLLEKGKLIPVHVCAKTECFCTLFLKSRAKKEVKDGLLPVKFTDWLETHVIVRKYRFLDFCTIRDL